MTDFEATVARIVERTGLSRDEVLIRIMLKWGELKVVTVTGAAGMVARELGVE